MTTRNKYAIHPDFAKIPVVSIRFSPLVIGLLNLLLRLTRLWSRGSSDVVIERHAIAGEAGQSIEVRVVKPVSVKPDAPALIYYHGGAFAMTYASLHLQNAAHYASQTGCITVFVCYRLAIKHPFPAGFDDAYGALAWVAKNAVKLGIDRERIAVGGDSAGGALAAGVAQKARDQKLLNLCGQLLIYPVLDSGCDTPSAVEFDDVPLFNAISNRRMWAMYLRRYAGDASPDYAAPGLGDPNELPPSYIETAEFDPLRDEGLNYARALDDCGNSVTLNATSGTVHGYDGSAKSEIAVASMRKRIDFLKSVFGVNKRL